MKNAILHTVVSQQTTVKMKWLLQSIKLSAYVLRVAKIYGFIFSNMHVMLRYCNCASLESCFLCLKLGHVSLFTVNFPVSLTHMAFFLLLLTAFIVHVTLYHYLDKLKCQSIRI